MTTYQSSIKDLFPLLFYEDIDNWYDYSNFQNYNPITTNYQFSQFFNKFKKSNPTEMNTDSDETVLKKHIDKKQQGGQINMDEQQIQLQIIQLVLAAMNGDEEATKAILQIMLAAQQGDLQAMLLAQMIQQVALGMLQLQLVLAARFGAKLNYIRHLKGKCPEGYEMGFYKAGGRVCKKCMKKASSGTKVKKPMPMDPVESFKCGRRMRRKK